MSFGLPPSASDAEQFVAVPSLGEAPPRGNAWIAWSVILLFVFGIIGIQTFLSSEPVAEEDGRSIDDVAFQFQAKYMVGAAQMVPADEREVFIEQIPPPDSTDLRLQLEHAVLVGELEGVDSAVVALENILLDSTEPPSTPELKNTLAALKRLYADYSQADYFAESVPAAERDLVVQQLGWFGRLALHPADTPDSSARQSVLMPAYITVGVVLSGVTVFGLLFLAGCGGLLLMFILAMMGKLKSGLSPPRGESAIYAETFAFWLVLFIVLGLGAGVVAPEGFEMVATLVGFFGSLVALAWPVARGIPWHQVREDIGWTAGRQPLLEPFCGIAAYAMTLPFFLAGVVVMLFLMFFQRWALQALGFEDPNPTPPSHPVINDVLSGGIWQYVQVLLLASVAAPIIEETMFRGVLYRHLRSGTHRLGFVFSFPFSAFVTSLIFAAIHPQGIVAIPALMGLAFGFTLVREWRGTLIPAMLVHGMHNGTLLCLLILLTSGN